MDLSRLSACFLMVALLAGGASCDKLGLGGGDPSAEAESDEEDAPKKKKKKKKGDDEDAPKAPTATAQLTFQAPTGQPTGPGVPLGPAPTQPAVASVDYFGVDAATIPTRFKEKFPQGARVLEVIVYPTYVFTNVQDSGQKTHVDRYQLREGLWREPEPVKLFGDLKTEADIAKVTFDPNEVAFSEVSKLAKDAIARLKVETPSVSHMVIKRPLPFDNEVRIRVFVNGPRSNGYVDYDKKGVFQKAHD
jgi:hypothetical protein